MKLRPCFLVIDPEHRGAISTRKLVLETAKYNVITAYSCEEAAEELERFPRVDGVIMDGHMSGTAPVNFLEGFRQRHAQVKLVLVGHYGEYDNFADRTVSSFMPAELLRTLEELFPAQTAQIAQHEAEIKM